MSRLVDGGAIHPNKPAGFTLKNIPGTCKRITLANIKNAKLQI
jgi:hypothetical protein